MENKYYTPNLEDLYIGYECEIRTPLKWITGIFPELVYLNPELNEFGNDELMRAAHAILRTKYLIKEQIESLGVGGL